MRGVRGSLCKRISGPGALRTRRGVVQRPNFLPPKKQARKGPPQAASRGLQRPPEASRGLQRPPEPFRAFQAVAFKGPPEASRASRASRKLQGFRDFEFPPHSTTFRGLQGPFRGLQTGHQAPHLSRRLRACKPLFKPEAHA